jgi:histidinol-phosphate phosphatase family protein
MWNIDSSWTLFLDRDGVINVRLMDDYVKSIKEFVLLPGVDQAIARANQCFGKVVVVTNQQGIGKKMMTERNLIDIHHYCSELLQQANAHIDRYYFAPDLAHETNELRKPNTGMAMQAKEDFPEIDFSKSVMVGDSNSDIEFGKKLGMRTVFIRHESDKEHPTADVTVNSLLECINKLVV